MKPTCKLSDVCVCVCVRACGRTEGKMFDEFDIYEVLK